MRRTDLPLAQLPRLLDVSEDALRSLIADSDTAEIQGDTTLVALTVAAACAVSRPKR